MVSDAATYDLIFRCTIVVKMSTAIYFWWHFIMPYNNSLELSLDPVLTHNTTSTSTLKLNSISASAALSIRAFRLAFAKCK